MTRRRFVTQGSLLLAAGLTVPQMLEACAIGGTSGGTGKTATLTFGTTSEFTTLDPNTINTAAFPWRNTVFDPVLSIPVVDIPTFKLGDIQPWLASKYTVPADDTSITLTIRQGVKFHDGHVMTPDDVVKVMKWTLDKTTGGTVAGSLAAIKDAAVSGGDIILKVDPPDVDALYRLTLWRVQSPDNLTNNKNTAIGTGPYKFVEWAPGDHVTVQKNPDYWKPLKTSIERITFKFFSDPDAMLNAALDGQIDVLFLGRTNDASALSSKGWNVVAAPIADYEMLVLNYTSANSVLQNVNIRQAVARSINRDAIVKTVYSGLVQPITIPMPPSDPSYDHTIAAEWDYNLDAAAQFVKKSGLTNPTFKMRMVPSSEGQLIAEIIKADLAKIGITANLEPVDSVTLTSDGIKGNFECNVYACSVGIPNVQDFEDCSVYRPNTGPFSGSKTFPDYRDAYYKAAATLEPTARLAAFKEVWKTLHNDAWAIPICMRGTTIATKNLQGVVYDAKTHPIYNDIVKSA